MNEICQLHKADIIKVDNIWCFDINSKDNNKRAKTASSLRRIPVHPTILKLGFLDYKDRISTKHLWHNLPYDDKNGYSYLFQKWYQRFNRNKITQDKKKCFHSFRHSFTNNLKQSGVDVQIIAELVGHVTGSITMERYGKGFQPQIMLDSILKLDYGFDIIAELKKRNTI